jgi:hypothetical protein
MAGHFKKGAFNPIASVMYYSFHLTFYVSSVAFYCSSVGIYTFTVAFYALLLAFYSKSLPHSICINCLL